MFLCRHKKTQDLHLIAEYGKTMGFMLENFNIIKRIDVPRALRNTSYHYRELNYVKKQQERMLTELQQQVEKRKSYIQFINKLLKEEGDE